MAPQAGNPDAKTPVVVKLSADNKGVISLGIRINGSNECLLAQGVSMPSPNQSTTWTKTIGEIMK